MTLFSSVIVFEYGLIVSLTLVRTVVDSSSIIFSSGFTPVNVLICVAGGYPYTLSKAEVCVSVSGVHHMVYNASGIWSGQCSLDKFLSISRIRTKDTSVR